MTMAETSLPKPAALPAASAVSISSNPYVGPRPFEREEEHLFFGRDREARDLISLIIANRVFVLYSQSGAGKSSLLNTKIIIGLEKVHCSVLPIARVQGKVPASANEPEIRNIFSLNAILSLRGAAKDVAIGSLSKMSVVEFVETIHTNMADDDEPIVLVFDQFEELFAFYEHRWPDRAVFLREITDALEKFPELKVVFSLREDYIAKLDAYCGMFPNKLRAVPPREIAGSRGDRGHLQSGPSQRSPLRHRSCPGDRPGSARDSLAGHTGKARNGAGRVCRTRSASGRLLESLEQCSRV
jgi:hypothetical protein